MTKFADLMTAASPSVALALFTFAKLWRTKCAGLVRQTQTNATSPQEWNRRAVRVVQCIYAQRVPKSEATILERTKLAERCEWVQRTPERSRSATSLETRPAAATLDRARKLAAVEADEWAPLQLAVGRRGRPHRAKPSFRERRFATDLNKPHMSRRAQAQVDGATRTYRW